MKRSKLLERIRVQKLRWGGSGAGSEASRIIWGVSECISDWLGSVLGRTKSQFKNRSIFWCPRIILIVFLRYLKRKSFENASKFDHVRSWSQQKIDAKIDQISINNVSKNYINFLNFRPGGIQIEVRLRIWCTFGAVLGCLGLPGTFLDASWAVLETSRTAKSGQHGSSCLRTRSQYE